MVEFDINERANKDIEVRFLYGIYGEDAHGIKHLLIIGHPFNAGQYIFPVIDLTDPLQPCKFYQKNDRAGDICEIFGINPQTARYLDDYASFTLIFQHDEGDD